MGDVDVRLVYSVSECYCIIVISIIISVVAFTTSTIISRALCYLSWWSNFLRCLQGKSCSTEDDLSLAARRQRCFVPCNDTSSSSA